MAQYNLGTVVGFEFFRTIKKKSFWLGTLFVPVMIAVVFGLIYLGNKSTDSASDKQKQAKFSFLYTDESKLIGTISSEGVKEVNSKRLGIDEVKSGKVDAYFYYPKNPDKNPIQIYAKDVGLFDSNKYDAVAKSLLEVRAKQKVGDNSLLAVASGDITTNATLYKDGKRSGGIWSVLPPLLFLVAFYLVIAMLGNQMLNSTVEEKENRVTEMILTTLNPTTLIVGKIISNFMAGILQLLIFSLPVIVGYLWFKDQLNVPNFDLSQLIFEPSSLIVGVLLLIGGFMVFTGALVAIGALMPTAKEAGQYFGVAMVAVFVPFYAISFIISDPHALIVQIFTYFPLSAPITAMLRNAFGTLSPLEASIVIVELFVVGVLIIGVAVRLFRYGSMEYNNKLSLKILFNKTK